MPLAEAPLRIKRARPAIARLRFMFSVKAQRRARRRGRAADARPTSTASPPTSSRRDSALVDYDYDFPPGAGLPARVARIVADLTGVSTTPLQLVAEPPGGVGRAYFAPATFQWNAPPRLHPLFIVQTPAASPGRFSMADCQLAGVDCVGVKKDDKSDSATSWPHAGRQFRLAGDGLDQGLVVGLALLRLPLRLAQIRSTRRSPSGVARRHRGQGAGGACRDAAAETELTGGA